MAQESASRKLDQYIVRFPDGMRDRLKLEAEANGRSLNAEIISRLEGSFENDDLLKDHEARLCRLESAVDDLRHIPGLADYPENRD